MEHRDFRLQIEKLTTSWTDFISKGEGKESDQDDKRQEPAEGHPAMGCDFPQSSGHPPLTDIFVDSMSKDDKR
jgi:hypothetical protein